jgi:hypothetical protein
MSTDVNPWLLTALTSPLASILDSLLRSNYVVVDFDDFDWYLDGRQWIYKI